MKVKYRIFKTENLIFETVTKNHIYIKNIDLDNHNISIIEKLKLSH